MMSAQHLRRRARCYLAFPPGWSLCCGSPHVALPAIAGFLRKNGVDVAIGDLNLAWAKSQSAVVSGADAFAAVNDGSLDAMNDVYFAKEDPLQELAATYGGEWNLQSGFLYKTPGAYRLEVALEYARSVSPFTQFFCETAIPDALDFEPDVIGITVAAWQQLIPALEFATRLRDAGFDGCIALGGNTISRLADALACEKLFAFVDVLGLFAGERTMLAIVRAVERGSFEGIEGIVWSAGGSIQKSMKHSKTDRLELIPGPDFADLEVGSYPGLNYLPIFLNRGCYFGKCTFCAIPYGWGAGGYDGARSTQNVADDLARLVEVWGIRRFKFVDEAIHPSQLASLARAIIDRQLSIEWEVYVRLEPAWYKNDFVSLVSRSGLRKAYFGLELLPSTDRGNMGKHDRPEPDRLLRTCHDNGVRAHLFCMFGYPGTSRRDAMETTEYVLRQADRIDSADFFPWTLARHTAVAGVEITNPIEECLRLEFDHRGCDGNLSSEEIAHLATEMEELVWDEAPRLLHPIYRMVSPWTDGQNKAASFEAARPNRTHCSDEIGHVAFTGGRIACDTGYVSPKVADVAAKEGCVS